MLPEFFQPANLLLLFHLLFRIDKDLANQIQAARCPHCGGPLHIGNYQRKPRGTPEKIPEEYLIRQSLCCGNKECRRRSMPPSVLFMGRRVYWGCVILVVMALRQNTPRSSSKAKLQELFEVSRQTINRWATYFRDLFPKSRQWQRLRGMVEATVDDTVLPGALLAFFYRHHARAETGLICCLRFLATGLLR